MKVNLISYNVDILNSAVVLNLQDDYGVIIKWLHIPSKIRVIPKNTNTFTFWAKIEIISGQFDKWLIYFNNGTSEVSLNNGLTMSEFLPNNTWQEITITVDTIPAFTRLRTLTIYPKVYYNRKFIPNIKIWIDDITLPYY
jgi:hypothetical protein